MRKLEIEYPEDDLTPDAIDSLAASLDVTPEMIVKRAVDAYLEVHSPLKEATPADLENVTTLQGLFAAHGITKPK